MADTPEKDDRTEEPTQRRLDQAIERGDVAKSQEISTFFVLGGFALAVQLSAPFIAFGILFNLGLGVLSRLMPQLQVFFLACRPRS